MLQHSPHTVSDPLNWIKYTENNNCVLWPEDTTQGPGETQGQVLWSIDAVNGLHLLVQKHLAG